ncbi:MAG: extracellular solute-binding protein [Clostridia bacterium]|nr:extracellular solute-binding protein [Clostridia bacterium]
MRKPVGKRLLSLGLAAIICLTSLPLIVSAAGSDESGGKTTPENQKATLQEVTDALKTKSYNEYVALYGGVGKGTEDITIPAVQYDRSLTTAAVSVETDYNGRTGKSLRIGDDGIVTWKVTVPEDGLYAIDIDYCPVTQKTNSVEKTLYINGSVPFAEVRDLIMKKSWIHEYAENGRFEMDSSGNELRPKSTVLYEWATYTVNDPNGYFPNPFQIFLKAGENTIGLGAVREESVIGGLRIYPYKDKISYTSYSAGKSEAVTEGVIHINAETPSKVSDYTIYPVFDRKSSMSEPQDPAKIRLNSIGGEKWVTPGQWVEYEFEISTAGMYEIVFRYRQNELTGMYTSRRIYIDGEVPFEEANYIKFNYNTNWQVEAANDGADTFQFWLEPGKHTLRLEITLGEMGTVVGTVSKVLSSLNKDYLEVIKLTGAVPDEYRDYGFGRVLPDVVRDFVIQGQVLKDVVSYVENMADIKSENSATIDEIQRLLMKMGTDEEQIAKNIGDLKSNVGTLGEWINNVKKQPLEIDWINIQPASAEKPKAEANFFQSLWYEIQQFFATFFNDYNSLGASGSREVEEKEKEIEVWVTTGRDQAQIIRNLIDNDFGPQSNIEASLKLVAGGTLLPSVLAGIGPEVALPGTGADPIQYAIRSAVHAVNPEAYEDKPDDDEETKARNAEMREIFSNFDEVTSRFTPAALIPMTLYGKTYGLPDTQTWDMMFYRTDIITNLGFEIPKTWDELLAMIPVLQFNNMDIGLPNNYKMFLYQMGGDLWADDGMRINLDANLSLESFESMCNMFTQYSLPVTYDAVNRFRSGEMPLFIGGYTTYNNIIIFATEIAGLWEFGPIPGFEKEDGTIDNTSVTTSSALVMMSGADDIESAWKFMDWYTDTRFQVDYSNELVAILGDAAKNATANIEALEELPWTSREYAQLMKQKDHTTAIIQYPGTYIIDRYTGFAFADAYNNHADPVQSLLGHINAINKEITRKRTEFDLETLEVGQTLASKRLSQAEEAIGQLESDSASHPAVAKAKAAIESKDIEALREAAEELKSVGNSSTDMISGYLADAADALESYLAHK